MIKRAAAHIEVLLFVRYVEERAQAMKTRSAAELEEMRTEAIGALSSTLDRIEDGLGRRLIKAMYPEHARLADALKTANVCRFDPLADTPAAAGVM